MYARFRTGAEGKERDEKVRGREEEVVTGGKEECGKGKSGGIREAVSVATFLESESVLV